MLPLLMLALSGCGDQAPGESEGFIAQVGRLSVELLDHYAAFKQAKTQPAHYQAELFETLRRRTAVADYLAGTALADMPQLQLEWLEVRNNLLIQRYFEQYLQVEVTDEVIARYYHDHSEQFIDTYARVAYILLPTANRAGDSQAIAKGFAGQLRAGKTLLAATAEYKKSSGKNVGMGELRLRQSDHTQRALFTAVQTLSAGEVSEPVQTQRGVYTLKLMDTPVSRAKPLHEVETQIRARLYREYQEKEMQRLLQASAYTAISR